MPAKREPPYLTDSERAAYAIAYGEPAPRQEPAKLISTTVYFNGCDPIHRVQKFPSLTQARIALADILRQARHDLNVVILRDERAAYTFTNAQGPRVFERTLRITPGVSHAR